MNATINTLTTNFAATIRTAVLKELATNHADIFKTKMTLAKLEALFATATDDDAEASGTTSGEVSTSESDRPEGWEQAAWDKFVELQTKCLADEEGYANVMTNKVFKKPSSKMLKNDELRVCAPEGEDEWFNGVVEFLGVETKAADDAEEDDDAEEVSEKKTDDDDDDEADSEEEEPTPAKKGKTAPAKATKTATKETAAKDGPLIDGYDKDMLKGLRKALAKAKDDDTFVNIASRRKIEKNAKNEKTHDFTSIPNLAISMPKDADAKAKKTIVTAVKKMLGV